MDGSQTFNGIQHTQWWKWSNRKQCWTRACNVRGCSCSLSLSNGSSSLNSHQHQSTLWVCAHNLAYMYMYRLCNGAENVLACRERASIFHLHSAARQMRERENFSNGKKKTWHAHTHEQSQRKWMLHVKWKRKEADNEQANERASGRENEWVDGKIEKLCALSTEARQFHYTHTQGILNVCAITTSYFLKSFSLSLSLPFIIFLESFSAAHKTHQNHSSHSQQSHTTQYESVTDVNFQTFT